MSLSKVARVRHYEREHRVNCLWLQPHPRRPTKGIPGELAYVIGVIGVTDDARRGALML